MGCNFDGTYLPHNLHTESAPMHWFLSSSPNSLKSDVKVSLWSGLFVQLEFLQLSYFLNSFLQSSQMDLVTVTWNHPNSFVLWAYYFSYYPFGLEKYPNFNTVCTSNLSSNTASYRMNLFILQPKKKIISDMIWLKTVDCRFLIYVPGLEISST